MVLSSRFSTVSHCQSQATSCGLGFADNFSPVAAAGKVLDAAGIQRRPYQRRMAIAALQMLAGRWRSTDGTSTPATGRVLIESPAGSGKTVIGLAVACAMQRATGCRVGWVAMRRNSLARVAAENAMRRFGVDLQMINMFDKSPEDVDLLVVDEVECGGAAQIERLQRQLQPRWTLGLAINADPMKPCFDRVIRDEGLAQLIADGYLSSYDHFTLAEFTPAAVAKQIIDQPTRWGQSLVYFHRRQQALACVDLLQEQGLACELLGTGAHRERQLSAFERGKTRVLINTAAVPESLDCPDLKSIFCRPAGRSSVVKMIGPLFHPSLGEPVKQIVQCRQAVHPMWKTAGATERFVWRQEGWQHLVTDRQLSQIATPSLGLDRSNEPKDVLQIPHGRLRCSLPSRSARF